MNPKWLLQENIFNENFDNFHEALRKSGSEFQSVKYIPFSGEIQTPYDEEKNGCIISYGSLNLIKIIKRTKPWIPGCWCDLEKFKCLHYYSHFGKYLLNGDYLAIPLQELYRLAHTVFERFGNPIFIRPDRGDKPFTGHTIYSRNFESDFNALSSKCDPETIVLISAFKDIINEYRFVIANNSVITGTTYRVNKELVYNLVESGEAYNTAQTIARDLWQPDPIYVVDICENADGFHLLEINSFSCSGFYACDKQKIVQAANELAILEWNDIMGYQ